MAENLSKMKGNHHIMLVNLRLTQDQLERMIGEFKEKQVLTAGLPKAVKSRKLRRSEQKVEREEMTRSQRYRICLREGLCCFVWTSYVWIWCVQTWTLLSCVMTEKAWLGATQVRLYKESGEGSVFAVGAKKMVFLRCLLQLALEMSEYKTSTGQGCEKF